MTTDAQILSMLRSASGGSVSGTELSHALGITRAAVWFRMEELRKLGYDIEASPHRGYRLLNTPDVLNPDDLMSRLGGARTIGRDVRVFQTTTSTNDIIEKLARDGVKEGVVVFAESQTRGRGRLGRRWLSPAQKGLWFSVLLRPQLRPQEATQLTVAFANALARAIEDTLQLRPEIKWPNDILLHGKKVAGILTELNAELDRVKYVILGVGVNANLSANDFPQELRKTASSLASEAGRPLSRPELAAAILLEMDRDYARVGAGHFAAVADEWAARCATLGQDVVIRLGDRRVRGRAETLDDDGALLVRTDHGRLERIVGGDLTLEK